MPQKNLKRVYSRRKKWKEAPTQGSSSKGSPASSRKAMSGAKKLRAKLRGRSEAMQKKDEQRINTKRVHVHGRPLRPTTPSWQVKRVPRTTEEIQIVKKRELDIWSTGQAIKRGAKKGK